MIAKQKKDKPVAPNQQEVKMNRAVFELFDSGVVIYGTEKRFGVVWVKWFAV
tara:strand:- start:1701 stop:1856 length:156 start_codon:yes stop_codon:yes gene_type:complete